MKPQIKLRRTPPASRRERGYILITLMLMVTLLAIAAAIAAPLISFQIRRDREDELIHRGVQYSRAVKKYFKKFGRYPTRIEDLDSTNNLRFLRRHYKDPITGKDFKLLHFGEVRMTFGPGIAGATPAGMAALGGTNAQNLANAAMAGAMIAAQPNGPAGLPVSTSSQANTGDSSSTSGTSSSTSGTSASTSSSGGFGSPSGQVFGGGPIVGVVSTSDKETIRVFNKKNHYKDWQFIYDPSTDRGGLLNTPAQPPLKGAVAPVQPGVPGTLNGMGGMQGIQGPQGIQNQPPPQPPPPSQPPQDQQ